MALYSFKRGNLSKRLAPNALIGSMYRVCVTCECICVCGVSVFVVHVYVCMYTCMYVAQVALGSHQQAIFSQPHQPVVPCKGQRLWSWSDFLKLEFSGPPR